jgi:hypothetical protein
MKKEQRSALPGNFIVQWRTPGLEKALLCSIFCHK